MMTTRSQAAVPLASFDRRGEPHWFILMLAICALPTALVPSPTLRTTAISALPRTTAPSAMFGARWSEVWDELDDAVSPERTPRTSFFGGTDNIRSLRAERAEQDNEESKQALTELLLCTKLRVSVSRKTVAVEVDDWQEMGIVNKLAVPRVVTTTRVVDLPSVLSRDKVKRDVFFPGLGGTRRILNPDPPPREEEEAELPPQLVPMRLSM